MLVPELKRSSRFKSNGGKQKCPRNLCLEVGRNFSVSYLGHDRVCDKEYSSSVGVYV